MRRFIAALALVAMSTAAPAAPNEFYRYDEIGNGWRVWGHYTDTSDFCKASATTADGSYFLLGRNLKNGMLYIYIKNMLWNIIDKPETKYLVRVNIRNADGSVIGGNITGLLVDKNTIVFPNMKDFVEPFTRGSRLDFIFPGSIPNYYVGLKGSREVGQHFDACEKIYKDLAPPTKPQPPTPGGPSNTVGRA